MPEQGEERPGEAPVIRPANKQLDPPGCLPRLMMENENTPATPLYIKGSSLFQGHRFKCGQVSHKPKTSISFGHKQLEYLALPTMC